MTARRRRPSGGDISYSGAAEMSAIAVMEEDFAVAAEDVQNIL